MKRTALGVLMIVATMGVADAEHPSALTGFDCAGTGGAIAAMENSYAEAMGGACWGHFGHHTYDAGAVYEVGEVTGRVFSVEVQFSPPTEVMPPRPEPVPIPPLPLPGLPIAAPLSFEGSEDGRAWRTLGQIEYRLSRGSRQEIFFTFDAGGQRARFLRIRQPRSAAQGLSGYLDASSFQAALTPVHDQPVPPTIGPRYLTCAAHAFERFFAEHPCWYGGINRYDGASFFHTYLVGPATLTGLSARAVVLPWRSDDYSDRGGSLTDVTVMLQGSADGVTWTTIADARGRYGSELTMFVAGEVEATFLRLVPERHTGFDQHPALKHARGFLFDSGLTFAAS